jgi:hypothetical protein
MDLLMTDRTVPKPLRAQIVERRRNAAEHVTGTAGVDSADVGMAFETHVTNLVPGEHAGIG